MSAEIQISLLRMRADRAAFRVGTFLRGLKEKRGYWRRVSPDDHADAVRRAERFVENVMEFLGEDPSARLKPVRPTEAQIGILTSLLGLGPSIWVLGDERGRVREINGRPCVVRRYTSGDEGVRATLIVQTEICRENQGPIQSLAFCGLGVKPIVVLGLPEFEGDARRLRKILGFGGKGVTVDVGNEGEEIVIKTWSSNGRGGPMIERYHFLGTVERGEGVNLSLYGCNHEYETDFRI